MADIFSKRMTIYNDTPYCGAELADDIADNLRDSFESTKSDAKEVFNEDEISKYKITITVEVDH